MGIEIKKPRTIRGYVAVYLKAFIKATTSNNLTHARINFSLMTIFIGVSLKGEFLDAWGIRIAERILPPAVSC